MPMLEVDEQLATWQDLNEIPWTGMLVGNGASCAIWKPFRYKSLYHESCSDAHPNPLGPEAVNVFQKLETSNFELVLSALKTTSLVLGAMEKDPAAVDALYSTVQSALVEAVKSVHIPWASISEESKLAIKNELLKYEFVYSTNYDLILYWSVMHDGPDGLPRLFFCTRV